jgi:hypothetical protein
MLFSTRCTKSWRRNCQDRSSHRLDKCQTYWVANKWSSERYQIELPTLDQLLRFINSILFIRHQSSLTSSTLHQRPKLKKRFITRLQNLVGGPCWEWNVSFSITAKIHASPRYIDIAHAPSHDLVDQVGVDFRHLFVWDHRIAHEIGRADFDANAIVAKYKCHCVDDFKCKLTSVLGRATVAVGSIVEMTNLHISSCSSKEQ